MLETELVTVVGRLAAVFARRRVRHALIGGLAVGLRSRPRATKDADFIVHVPALAFPGLLEELLDHGFQFDLMEMVRRWSVERFLVLHSGRVRVDWMQPILPVYAMVLDTADERPWLDTGIRVATAEGLILTKLISFRPQDQADIETLLIANRDDIDLDVILNEWSKVAVGEGDRTAWLEIAIKRLVESRR
jgi:hypothetical protein